MNKTIVDANIILRVILNDNADMTKQALDCLAKNDILIKNEVMAEVVYVLFKFYDVEKQDILKYISNIIKFKNVHTESNKVILLALETFSHNNLDFVDCLLYAYNRVFGYDIFTFDKKLEKVLKNIN